MRPAPLGWLSKLGDRGNVAIMTAVVLPLLLLVGGFATDYGYASYLNQRLTQATDNAVLASVSQSAATAGGGYSNTKYLQQYGMSVFQSNIADLPIAKDVNFNLPEPKSNGTGGVTSQGTYTYSYPTFFAGVIGISSFPLQSTIKASANPTTYIDYYILVDVSQSMGIASTPGDMQALNDRVVANKNGSYPSGVAPEVGCVFGCHVIGSDQKFATHTNEYLAHSLSPYINLRIDAAVSAIQSIISDAQTASGTNKNIRIGLYAINRDPNKPGTYVTIISPPSSDYVSLMAKATVIELGGNISAGAGDSDFADELVFFNTLLPINGSGASAISPKNYVFLVTDGLTDASIGCLNCHPTVPFDPKNCDLLKLKSTVGTIYTTYNPIFQNNDPKQGLESNYANLVAPFVKFKSATNADPSKNDYTVVQDSMADALKACSSDASQFAFEAKDGPEISLRMRSLFASTLQNARLTQ